MLDWYLRVTETILSIFHLGIQFLLICYGSLPCGTLDGILLHVIVKICLKSKWKDGLKVFHMYSIQMSTNRKSSKKIIVRKEMQEYSNRSLEDAVFKDII